MTMIDRDQHRQRGADHLLAAALAHEGGRSRKAARGLDGRGNQDMAAKIGLAAPATASPSGRIQPSSWKRSVIDRRSRRPPARPRVAGL